MASLLCVLQTAVGPTIGARLPARLGAALGFTERLCVPSVPADARREEDDTVRQTEDGTTRVSE